MSQPAGADRTLLVSMPVASTRYPSLALGLLKQSVAATGAACDVRYFSLDYVDRVGAPTSSCLNDLGYYTALVGEWVFAEAARGEAPGGIGEAELRYVQDVFRPRCPQRQFVSRLLLLLGAREGASAFIDWCVDQVDWTRYAVLGLSTSFQQNMASLALARRVKARFPHVFVVFGGANCQGEMGLELHRRYRFIDAVCLGEGDRVLAELVRRRLAGEALDDLPGMVVRDPDGSSVAPAREADQIDDLDSLPVPDLSDFYRQRLAFPALAKTPATVVFETARGCWWGMKHHCTFCGLNGRLMSYRSKSQARAYAELKHLAATYGRSMVNTDAILNMDYFQDLIPRLAAEGPEVSVYWQMKSNLRADHIRMLSRAGIRRIQPGIEALDTKLLALMKKGCTMLQNVQVLKLAAENGITVAWNLLYGFPGEDPDSYARTALVIPALRHLQPPTTTGRVFADRFSPYFQRPAEYRVEIAPIPAYPFIYPFDDDGVRHLAYHFRMQSTDLDRAGEFAAPMRREQQLWAAHHRESALFAVDEADALAVHDRRWGWPAQVHHFEGADAEVLRLSGETTARFRLHARLDDRHGAARVDAAIESLIERGLLLSDGAELLGLPLRDGPQRAPTWREVVYPA